MTATRTLTVFVLDKSGSMTAHTQATIDGFNQFLADQQAIEVDAYLSLVQFDNVFRVDHVATPLGEVEPLNRSTYAPSGGTALYDAVGTAVKGAEAWLAKHLGAVDQVQVVILTDGQENASREWHLYANATDEDTRDVNNLIRWKQGEGWEFVFMGAGQSAWLEGNRFAAIPQAQRINTAATYDSYAGSYDTLSSSLRSSRVGGQSFAATASAAADESGLREAPSEATP